MPLVSDLAAQVVPVFFGQVLNLLKIIRTLSDQGSSEEFIFILLEAILIAEIVDLRLEINLGDTIKRVDNSVYISTLCQA